MATSAFERHRLLWAELVAQLTTRDGVRVLGDGGSTRYEDRETGRKERPSASISYVSDGGQRRIELELDRISVHGPDGVEETAPLNLSNAYRFGAFGDSERNAAGPSASTSCHSAREAAAEIRTMLFSTMRVPATG